MGDTGLFCTGGVGEVAARLLSALSAETMEPPVRRKQERLRTCNRLLTTCVVVVGEAHIKGHVWAKPQCVTAMAVCFYDLFTSE